MIITGLIKDNLTSCCGHGVGVGSGYIDQDVAERSEVDGGSGPSEAPAGRSFVGQIICILANSGIMSADITILKELVFLL